MKKLYLSIFATLPGWPCRKGGNSLWLLLIPLLSCLFVTNPLSAQNSQAKTYVVQGVVLNQNGEPLVGVSVTVPTTTNGTTTGKKGDYRIMVPRELDSLRFSFIGYKPVTLHVRDAQLVRMHEEVASVGEVVVTGIFTRKAESYTGSSKTIKASELKRVGNQNIFQSLKNLDPSLQIFSNLSAGSDPNAMPTMQLRGSSTFPVDATAASTGYSLKSNFADAPNTPLFIVDGFETKMEKVLDMDMNRIESLTILKDAAAKAIYGAKAANGVIVIETKRLGSNETRVTYTGSVDIEMPDLTSYDLCNSLEKLYVENLEGFYERKNNLADRTLAHNLYNQRLKQAKEGLDTYWLSKPLRTGVGHKHTVEVEMGEKALKAYATFSYNSVAGVMKDSDRETIQGDINLSYRYKKILFRNIMSISSNKSHDSPYGSFYDYTQLNPYFSPYDSYGNVKKELSETEYSNLGITPEIGNPLYNATVGTFLEDKYLDFTNNFQMEVDVVKGLKAVARLGISSKKTNIDEFYPGSHTKFLGYTTQDQMLRKGSYAATNGSSSSLSGDFRLQYNQKFGKHDFFLTGQMEISESKYTETTHYAEGFPNENMNNIIFARQYAEGKTPTGTEGLNRSLSFLGYLAYTYNNRISTDLTIRTGASSMYGNDNRWATFWSAGVAWLMHNESFLKNVSWIDELKLRGSVGTSGNQNFRQNMAIPVYRYITDRYYFNQMGAVLSNMENPNLSWEQKTEYSVGVDVRLSRLQLSAEYYLADTKNMVITRSIVPSTGFTSLSDNLGKVRNQGFDISATVTALRGKNGFLNVSASILTNKNKILKITDELRDYNEQQAQIAAREYNSTPVNQYEEGLPMNGIFAVPSLGIDPQTGVEVYRKKNGQITTTWNTNDRIFCGNTDPEYNGVLGLYGEYKGIGLSVSMTFLGGCYYYNKTLVDRVEDADLSYNVDRRVFSGRWQTPGQVAQYKKFSYTASQDEEGNGTYVKTQATSRFVQKRNEMELSSISAYYEFPQKLIRPLRLQRLRLSAYMNNVATFSSIKVERGLTYPFARTLSFSLSATF